MLSMSFSLLNIFLAYKKSLWAQSRLYRAGDAGLPYDDCGNYGGFSFEWTCQRLRDYYDTDNGLVKERARFELNSVMNHSDRVHELVITVKYQQFFSPQP